MQPNYETTSAEATSLQRPLREYWACHSVALVKRDGMLLTTILGTCGVTYALPSEYFNTTRESKKQDTTLFPITLPNIDRLSKFLYQQTQQ